MIEENVYTFNELLILTEEYRSTHPEQDNYEGCIDAGSPAETYYLGAVDFLQWLKNEKQFVYEPETYEDIAEEDLWMFRVSAADSLMKGLDQGEEENIQRD